MIYRTILYLFKEKILTKKQFERWNIAFLFLFLFFSWFLRSSFLFWCLNMLFFILFLFLFGVGAYVNRRKNFRNHLIVLLRYTGLMMQSGLSFRDALKSGLSYYQGPMHALFSEIFRSISFSQENFCEDPFTLEIIRDLKEIDQLPMNPLEHIHLLCHRLELTRKFEEKSNKVLYQIRVQSALMTFLFVGLMIYVLSSFPLKEVIFLVTIASFLFLSGLLWVFLDGRRARWNL